MAWQTILLAGLHTCIEEMYRMRILKTSSSMRIYMCTLYTRPCEQIHTLILRTGGH